jgi:hypothetical protein
LIVDLSTAPIQAADGTDIGRVLTFREMTERHRVTEEWSHEAKHDAQKGLVDSASSSPKDAPSVNRDA